MKAFIVSLQELFSMDSGNGENANFAATKRKLRIPMYQREYKWENSTIECLIRDISSRDKFLGITILDEDDDCYEIVDGQQRITTCFLILAGLYNMYEAQPLEQQSVLGIMSEPGGGGYVLKNDSIGNLINNHDSHMSVEIDVDADIYFQKEAFLRAFGLINEKLREINEAGQLRDFQSKLKDCKFLVMINDEQQHTQPIEQVFLDINEKAQRLDNEAVFKGHCFENFTNDALHPHLKDLWTELKRTGLLFARDFGYEDMNQYLYHYFLANRDRNLPQNMNPYGVHILEGLSMDDTDMLLKDIIAYGKHVSAFRSQIMNADYRFVDICSNSHEYRNTNDHLMLKTMSKEILSSSKPFYQKLPFFVLVHRLYKEAETTRDVLNHAQLKKIITNLYIYSALFIARAGRKSKSDIDESVREALNSHNNRLSNVENAVKLLRKNAVDSFIVNQLFKETDAYFIFSVMDNYRANENWLNLKYSRENGYTVEHLLVHDNRGMRVRWCDGDFSFTFSLPNERAAEYKKRTANYLILPRELNEAIEHVDITSKIAAIRNWYEQREQSIPLHIDLCLTSIEEMESYLVLIAKKGQTQDESEIKEAYGAFIESYFSPHNQAEILDKISEGFKTAFRN